MPKPNQSPAKLRPYLSLGVNLEWRDGAKEALADCPFCGAAKFSVDILTGQFRCFRCNEGKETGKSILGGNAQIFISKLWELSYEATKPSEYKELAENRKLLYPETLVAWEVAKSILTGEWLVPGYNVEGKLTSLYRYANNGSGKRVLKATAELGHKLFGVNLYDHAKPEVYLCEGPWDAMCLWELLGASKDNEEGIAVPTSNRSVSLLSSINVLAVPGCQTFFESWLPLFSGKSVTLLYDNDHEKAICLGCKKTYSLSEHAKCPACLSTKIDTKRKSPPAAYEAMKRVANILISAKEPPMEINWLLWDKETGWDSSLPSGYDVRDALNA